MDSANNVTNSTNCLIVSYWEQVVTGTVTLLISLIGLIGNSMLITAVLFSRKLHTSTNAFVTSLAVADLMTAFFLIWFAVGVLGPDGWPLPQAYWMCELTGFIIYACRGTSLYTLGTIAMNRLILITKSHLYERIFKSWRLGVLIAVPWVISWGFISILLLSEVGAIGYDKTDISCSVVSYYDKSDVLNTCLITIFIPPPLLVVLFSYTWIYIHLKKHFRTKKRILHISSPYATDGNSVDAPNASDAQVCARKLERQLYHGSTPNLHRIEQKKKISMEQVKITKNLFLVVCSIYICFLPYVIFILDKDSHTIFYTRMITLSNSAINFLIHAFKHPDFKCVLGHMIRRTYTDIPQPSRFLKFLISKWNSLTVGYG